MPEANEGPLVVLTLRVPAAHAAAVRAHAANLATTTGLRVSPSAAGAAVLAAGLVALELIDAPKPAQKGAKKTARKP